MPQKLTGERLYVVTVHVSAGDYLSVDLDGEFSDDRRADAAQLLQRAAPLLASGIRMEAPRPPAKVPERWEDREVTSYLDKDERAALLANPDAIERTPAGRVIWNRAAFRYVLAMSEAGRTINEIASEIGTGTEYAKGRVRAAERRIGHAARPSH